MIGQNDKWSYLRLQSTYVQDIMGLVQSFSVIVRKISKHTFTIAILLEIKFYESQILRISFNMGKI